MRPGSSPAVNASLLAVITVPLVTGVIWAASSKYQVLEAQPDVLDAVKQASRGKPVHRSVRLTPFGEDFCEVCLPFDD